MNEYISRDDVLRKFIEGDGHDDERFTEGYNFAVQEYREEVKEIPAADVKPIKHGRWIPDKNPYGKYFCSECNNARITFKEKYCSNCGARMDLKEGEKNAD